MYFVRIPNIIKKLYPKIIWEIPGKEKILYLTFDDGPHPEITPYILDQLDKYHAKASFFCLGTMAEKNPQTLELIRQKGHVVGNHSYSHPNGWKTNTADYLADIEKAGKIISSKIFRPPYGKIKRAQSSLLHSQFSIFNFSLLPGDYDSSISSEKCYQNLADNVRSGDIICLHDSEKAWKHLQYCLPRWLQFLSEQQYTLCSLPHG